VGITVESGGVIEWSVFGLKGRFYQPRPKAWVELKKKSALKGPFVAGTNRMALSGPKVNKSMTPAFGRG
jgi:hypothetical protein